MIIGTAGFTAAECVQKLEQAGMTPASGPVLVTGATGGVGSVAVKLLGQLGYQVTAVTGKAAKADWLKSLGAAEVISREDAAAGAEKPLLPETWGGVVDTVGGDILFNGVKSLRYGCSLAACGLVAAPTFGAVCRSRHVNSWASIRFANRAKSRNLAATGDGLVVDLSELEEALTLDTLSDGIDRILAGQWSAEGSAPLACSVGLSLIPPQGGICRDGARIARNHPVTVYQQRDHSSGLQNRGPGCAQQAGT